MSPCNFTIKTGVYPFNIMVSVDEDDDIVLKRLIKNGISKEECSIITPLSAGTAARTVMFESGATMIRLKSNNDVAKFFGYISHEAFHATTFILERVGIELKVMVSDEAYAYLIGYISESIIRRIKIF